MRVFVYFNLHRKCWSIKCMEGPMYGRIIGHANQVLLEGVTFKVSEAGRQRVLRERVKNVHAGVIGFIKNPPWFNLPETEVTYNPYLYESFVTKSDLKPISKARLVWMDSRRVFADLEGTTYSGRTVEEV